MELGAGGTVRKLVDSGAYVKSLVFSDCKKSVDTSKYAEDSLRRECELAAEHLGIQDHTVLEIPVREFPKHRQEILERIYSVRRDFEPDLVLTTWIHDLHQDHRTVARETVRAFMKSPSSVWSYQVPGACPGFDPQLFVLLSEEEAEKKVNLLHKYKSQVERRIYFRRTKIKGFLQYFGAFVRSEYAEGFVQNRGIITGF